MNLFQRAAAYAPSVRRPTVICNKEGPMFPTRVRVVLGVLTVLAIAACSGVAEPPFAAAVLGGPIAATANNNQTPPAGEPGQKTYVFRSLEDSTVPSRT